MAESINIMLETAQNQLDENENPPLLDLKLTVDGVCNDFTNPLATNNKNVFREISDESKSIETEKATAEQKILGNGEKVMLDNDVCLSLSATNNSVLANGTCESEDISCMLPCPNFMDNSACSNEGYLNSSNASKPDDLPSDTQGNVIDFSEISCKDLDKVNSPSSLSKDLLYCSALSPSVFSKSTSTSNSALLDALSRPSVESNEPVSENISHLPESAILVNVNNVDDPKNFPALSQTEDNLDGEEFQDAVQFFKDPSSFQFLENIKTSTHSESIFPRDSIYMNFDPLSKKAVPTESSQNNVPIVSVEDADFNSLAIQSDNKEVVSDKESVLDVSNKVPDNSAEDILPVENKLLSNVAPRQSFGNNLLSFDSPLKTNSARNSSETANEGSFSAAPKLYTEEEVQQLIKNTELSAQEVSLKKQREIEEEFKKTLQDKDDEIKKFGKSVFSIQNILEEFVSVTSLLAQKNESLSSKISELEFEKEKLNEELKTSTEDLQSVENTFADFHKRYEQCKGMLKTYKDNESSLKLQIESLKKKLEEQEQMYNMLQGRTEEMVEKANAEVANVKKGGDAQIAVLKAQLKKSELKVSSLESDLKQARIENDKLSGICDDLMAKVSES